MTPAARLPLLCLLLLLAACWAITPPAPEGPQAEEGEILISLQPFAPEAERISFSLAGISVERSDGTLVPLLLRRQVFDGASMKRQRIIAGGRLEAGDYRGLAFDVKKASLKTEKEEQTLSVPEQPVSKPAPFSIRKDKTLLVSLQFNYRDSLHNGNQFSPVFRSFLPERPLVGLTGYVTNAGSGTITVFDKKRMEVSGIIDIGKNPTAIVLDPVLKRAYVALPEADSVVAIDITSGEIFNKISLLGGDQPRDLGLSADGKTLLTVNSGSGSVSFIDPLSTIEMQRITVGDDPRSIVMDRAGSRAYVFNKMSNNLSVVDLGSRALVATVGTDFGPLLGEFNRNGDRLYVICEGSPYLTVFNPFTFSVMNRIYLGMRPASVKVDTTTDRVYVAGRNETAVQVYDPVSLLPVDVIETGQTIDFMTIDADSSRLLTLSSSAEMLTAVDLISRKLDSTIDVGKNPYRVRIIGER